ncbi:MAG: type II secretion system secretin GspD [Nitrospiraceae bacterium]|nr:type II secretion system secretin GspD [Nitrospiraceae bacterium]
MTTLIYARLSSCRSFFILCLSFLIMAGLLSPAGAAEARKSGDVTFNFVDVDLAAVTKFISEITGKNFIFDEKVKGKVTIIAPSKISINDAYSLFTSVLELKGYTVVPSGVDVYKIMPSAEAKQQGLRITTSGVPVTESSIARLITLKFISADDALKFLQPLVSKDGHISTFGPGNLILVVDSGLNIEKVLSIIDVIDKPAGTDLPEVVPLKYASADTTARLLNEGFAPARTRGAVQQTASQSAVAIADQRLNAVVLFGDKGIRESMKGVISVVDRPSPEAQGRINVYFLENADATDMAKVLEGIIRGTAAAKQQQAAVQASPFEAAGGITVTPDKATNSLIVMASPADYQNILQIIKQLDKRRRQVYVEAMIVEASMDKLRSLGVQWRATATKGGSPIAIGGFGTIDHTSFQSILQGLQGATAGGLGNFLNIPITTVDSSGVPTQKTLQIPGYAALFSLNDFRDTVNILSTPQILTSDNKEAEILVGENVPFISQSQTSVSTSVTTSGTTIPGVLNSIVRQDVGIILKITPQITEGDHVKLDIYQEISSVKNQSDALTVSIGPTITKRSTKTAVVVKDNQTVVIGGLMQENDEEKVTKMPVLGDIPVLGWLFKTKSASKTKTNLIVFLNPHVIKEPERLAEITMEKRNEFAKSNNRFAPGELMVKFKEGVPEEKVRAIISREGASVLQFMDKLQVYHLKLKEGQSVEEAAELYSALPEVRYAEPNYSRRMQ